MNLKFLKKKKKNPGKRKCIPEREWSGTSPLFAEEDMNSSNAHICDEGRWHPQGGQQLSALQMTSKIHKTAHRFQSKHASCGITSREAGGCQKQTKATTNDLGNLVWPSPSVEMLPRETYKSFFRTSLWIFSTNSVHLRVLTCCYHINNQRTVFSFWWIEGKFLFLTPVAGKNG